MNYPRQFLNDDYFTLGIEDWVNGVLKPVLETQRRVLSDYLDAMEGHQFRQQLSKGLPLVDQFVIPYVRDLKFNMTQTENTLGSFNMMMSISTVFIFPFSSQNTQKENVGGVNVEHSIDVIDACLRELDSMVYHSTFYDVPYSYHTPFIHMSGQVDYWDLKLLMFPFLPWVCHWRYF